jgi:hypothetical protein
MNKFLILLLSLNILYASNENKNELIDLTFAKGLFTKGEYSKSYDILNQLFLDDFDNTEINYYLAKSAIKLEKFGFANAAFDRILIKEDNNYFIMFEQEKLSYLQGNKKLAISNMEELLKEKLSDSLRKEIETFLDFAKNKKLYNLEATFLLSLNRSDNATLSPDDKYTLPNFQYLGEQGTSKVLDTYHIELLNLSLINKFKNNDIFRIRNNFTYFNKTFMNEKKENFEFYSYKPALEIINEDSMAFIGASFDRYQPGNSTNEDYFDAVGLESTYYFSKYAFDLNAYRFFQRNEDNEDKDFTRYQGRFRAFDLMGFDYCSMFYKDLAFKSNRSDIDKISFENVLAYNINLAKELILTPSLKYKITNYEDESIAFNSRRKDSLKAYKLELKQDLKKYGLLSYYISYDDNDSNHAEYDASTKSMGITYIKNFK